MLIIGHRGAAGLAPENSIEALRAGLEAGADMLEFDIHLTRDGIPILNHDFHTLRTHHSASIISHHTLTELRRRVALPIVTLEEVLDEFFGKILLNIELKTKGSARAVISLLEAQFIKRDNDWDNVILASFRGNELIRARDASPLVNLALLHHENPFLFIAYHRRLQLTAAGFHRLYISKLALEVAKQSRIFTYAYTVNRPQTALILAEQGLDAVVTNYPDRIKDALASHS